jgi:hypothetical protein
MFQSDRNEASPSSALLPSVVSNSENSNRAEMASHFHKRRTNPRLPHVVRSKRRSEAKMAKRSGYIVLCFLVFWLPLPAIVIWTRFQVLEIGELQFYLNLQVFKQFFVRLELTQSEQFFNSTDKN